ncbi:LVIVD repeat-containing protein [Parapedobacter koreensis]|uniref:Uncharacterized conserved protein n=1 Tax=Parapedobacter koreensis TaxID=332977 RepID=A0A1H7TRN4_9SPHI|nr:hypothetical protein [Parapedobacter koreensis]SEL87278.1 Uncharacterized conserved protein [Parapedobacter koreensis]
MNPMRRSVFGWPVWRLPIVILLVTTCSNPQEPLYNYRVQVPVYLNVSAVREITVGPQAPRKLSAAGKIYVYGDYLLINEPQKGVHIIDNRQPKMPRMLNFIAIPGNIDMAVNSHMLYADSYVDLLVFDISDPANVTLSKRLEDVFPHLYVYGDSSKIMTYKDSLVTSTTPPRPLGGWMVNDAFSSGVTLSPGGSYGQGGSMARFTLLGGHLYAVDQQSLRLFNVQDPDDPHFVQDIALGWGIETIFPFENKLFIGSTTGMHIYDASNPAAPEPMSVYSHFTACDPVVVNENHAFVTLRSGNFCQQGVDLLEVIDISDPYSPKLLKSYGMQNPHGLGLSENYLYVCEGKFGLKSYSIADVMNVDKRQMQHLRTIDAFDVIPGPKSLIVTGEKGISQYDYSRPNRLQLLSQISVKD